MTDQDRDFDIKYRPRKLSEVVGQEAAIKAIKGFKGKIPRVILLHGCSGTGKTTMARIIVHDIMGVPYGCMDLKEVNCGVVDSSIEMVREINAQLTSAPMFGGKRVWILDEIQVLSRQKFAQEALFKVLEECPDHVQFILATTDPDRLLPAIRNRCVQIAVTAIKDKDIRKLLDRIVDGENLSITNDVLDRIVTLSAGCARDAVKALQKIAGIVEEGEQFEALGTGFGEDSEPFELVRALLYSGNWPNWAKVRDVLKKLDESEPEGLRCMILAAARTSLLKDGGRLHHAVIETLADSFDDRRSGKALLASKCWLICHIKQQAG